MSDESGSDDECDHCGAMLPPVDVDGVRTCLYCNTSYGPRTPRRERPPGGPDPAAPPPGGPPPPPGTQRVGAAMPATSTGRGGCLATWIILVVVLAGIVPVVIAVVGTSAIEDAFDDIGGQISGVADRRVSGETALLLPGEPNGAVGLVALTSYYDRGSATTVHEVARYDGADKPLWTGPALGESAYQVAMASDGRRVVYADESQVIALDLADGVEQWRTPVSDVVDGRCATCVSMVGGQVLVTSADGVLHALDGETGATTWERRFEDQRGTTHVAGDRIVVIDGPPSERRAIVLGVPDGAELASFTPSCADAGAPTGFGDGIDVDSPVLPQLDGSIVVAYGTWPGCIDRWDVATATLRWQAKLPETSYSWDLQVVQGGATLVTQDGEGSLAAVDLESGAARTLPAGEDVELYPVGLGPDVVIALAKGTRGSARWDVRGLDPATGAVRWTSSLGEAVPSIDAYGASAIVSSNETHAAVHVDGAGVHVVSLDGGIGDLTVQHLDPATGTAEAARVIPMDHGPGSLSFVPLGWPPNRSVLLLGDDIAVVDLPSATLAARYGG